MDHATLDALEAARASEREQAAFYRALAAEAEESGDALLAERLNGLGAEEQHQLSRLTERLVELGETPDSLDGPPARAAVLRGWEADARRLESGEQRRYELLLERNLDPATRRLVEDILRVERLHGETLGDHRMGA